MRHLSWSFTEHWNSSKISDIFPKFSSSIDLRHFSSNFSFYFIGLALFLNAPRDFFFNSFQDWSRDSSRKSPKILYQLSSWYFSTISSSLPWVFHNVIPDAPSGIFHASPRVSPKILQRFHPGKSFRNFSMGSCWNYLRSSSRKS